MVVVASYLSLPSAQVAASVLRSAGLTPILFDEQQSYARWTMLSAIGGCRLAVRSEEAVDALTLLTQAVEPDSASDLDASRGWLPRVIASFSIVLLTPALGWLVLGISDRRGRWTETLLGIALAWAVLCGMLASCWILEIFIAGRQGFAYGY